MFLPLKDHNPTRTTPYVTVTLIALNILVFLVEMGQGQQLPQFLARWGAVPYFLLHGREAIELTGGPLIAQDYPGWFTAFSSMFLHGGFLHLAFNMLYLWIFGNNIEDFLGHLRFLFFYLATGLAGLLAHVLLHPAATVPVIGASGAISGVLGAYMVVYPHARVTTLVFLLFFVTFIQLPAMVLLGFWIFIQVLSGLGSLGSGQGGTAHWAHIGGFVAGYLYLRYVFGPGRAVVARRKQAMAGFVPPEDIGSGPRRPTPDPFSAHRPFRQPGQPPPPPPRVGHGPGGDPISRFLQELDRREDDDEKP